MGLDREAVQRRDFPIVRRGYDPAAVDAHLSELAGEVERLAHGGPAEPSLANAAGSQVQRVLEAAQKAAAEIESEARRHAAETRARAQSEARASSEQAIAAARAQIAAAAQAAQALLERLSLAELGIDELLHAPGSDRGEPAKERQPARAGTQGAGPPAKPSAGAQAPRAAKPAGAAGRPPQTGDAGAPEPAAEPAGGDNGELDGARLVALNMALSGESREATERYLAEHFKLAERARLIDEVYAAIEA
jgi:DivIVA domain-containing protein